MPVDQLWLARSRLERNRLPECLAICDLLLNDNPGDQAAWFVKCQATIRQNFIDDIELEEESFAEVLMDENAIASVPRPGTSLSAPKTAAKGSASGSYDQGIRPVSNSGRPMTGFARPGSSRPMSGSTDIRDALQSSRRAGTAAGGRPMTNMGREIRLGTASLYVCPFINAASIIPLEYAHLSFAQQNSPHLLTQLSLFSTITFFFFLTCPLTTVLDDLETSW